MNAMLARGAPQPRAPGRVLTDYAVRLYCGTPAPSGGLIQPTRGNASLHSVACTPSGTGFDGLLRVGMEEHVLDDRPNRHFTDFFVAMALVEVQVMRIAGVQHHAE